MDLANDYLMMSLEPSKNVDRLELAKQLDQRSSSCDFPYDQSIFSQDVDFWIRGNPMETGIQCSSYAVAEQSTLTSSSHINRLWYICALLLQIFNYENHHHWRLTPSIVLNGAVAIFSNVGRVYRGVRGHFRRFAQGQVLTSNTLATAMDVVLIIYSIGFLILSMYEASLL